MRQYVPLGKLDPRGPGQEPEIPWKMVGMVAINMVRRDADAGAAEGSRRQEAVAWCS